MCCRKGRCSLCHHGFVYDGSFHFAQSGCSHSCIANICAMDFCRATELHGRRLPHACRCCKLRKPYRYLGAFDGTNEHSQVVYGLETGAAYSVGARFHGLANNSMTDEQRRTLSPRSPEYAMRVGGSKLQLMGWSLYTLLLWLLKLCLNIFYTRLT